MIETIQTRCCVVGGGPAGVMLGLLLARAGVEVVVLEKHSDFLRDFRGDTIHPSTLEVMNELGWLDDLLARPHQKIFELSGQIGHDLVRIADFRRLPTRCRFIALMPQWDFLDFLVTKARDYPSFRIEMESQATDLIEENGRVAGVEVQSPKGTRHVRAGLVVGADGRHSTVQKRAGLERVERGAPMDVLWMRIRREATDPGQTFGHAEPGKMFFMIDRSDYWQCGYLVPKGGADAVREKGMPWLRAEIRKLSPFLNDRVEELASWDQIRVLTVTVDRLKKWSRPGLLCIGDAAHAMSPIGGVGINLAIQDAVATANLLSASLLKGLPSDKEVDAVQARRDLPTRATQRLQIAIQDNVIQSILSSSKELSTPWAVRLLDKSPLLQTLPAGLVGMGFRPEHIARPS